jgi:uncharacterized membrane protein YbhN (UPF0104 family)
VRPRGDVRGALRGFGARHRRAITVACTTIATAALVAVLAGHRHQFAHAISSASIWVLLLAAALQIVALLARTEAWHGCIQAAGGTMPRRLLYRASSMAYVGCLLNAQVGMAARIGALRRSCPADSPAVTTLLTAELPIMAVELLFGAVTSFTLIGPLGLPWWTPIVVLVAVGAIGFGLRHLALRPGRDLWRGLLVLRSMRGGRRLLGFVMIAVLAQICRNWALLHAVGVHASFFDAIAVLIAMSTLSQLPIGPSVGAGAAVLILGRHGVAAVAAAGILSTATGIVGGLMFAAWAGADRLWVFSRRPRPAPMPTSSPPRGPA